jgi:hypothetical protein
MLCIGVGILILHKYALAIAMTLYIFWGLGGAIMHRFRRKSAIPAPASPASPTSAPEA